MRKNTVFSLLLLVALVGLKASPVFGQCYSGFDQSRAWGVGSCRSGSANLIQAAGYYNLNTSQAAINFETARSMDRDNQLKGTQTFFEMRRINVASRQAEEGRGMTSEEAWHYAHLAAPKPLTASELDPATGKIHWPTMLQDPRYNNYRNQLDQFFVLREGSHGGIGYENFVQSQRLIQSFLAALRNNLDEYRSADYVTAKNFIESLENEARRPAGSVVTMR